MIVGAVVDDEAAMFDESSLLTCLHWAFAIKSQANSIRDKNVALYRRQVIVIGPLKKQGRSRDKAE